MKDINSNTTSNVSAVIEEEDCIYFEESFWHMFAENDVVYDFYRIFEKNFKLESAS